MSNLDTPTDLPWYKSHVIVGALVSAIFKLLATIGVATDFSEEETGAIVTLAMLLISLLGDYVAGRARLVQRTAPPIRFGSGYPRARSPLIASLVAGALAMLLLSGCAGLGGLPPSPASAADQTILDEQAGLGVEAGYRAFLTVTETAADVGAISGTRAAQVLAYDDCIFAGVTAVRDAYDAGNAESYREAAIEARRLIGLGVTLLTGGEAALCEGDAQ